MKEISNKVLMYVLFVAVVVSVGSMMYTFGAISRTGGGPTGMATTSGTVDVTLTSNLVVNVTDTTIDYGTGYVSESDPDGECLLNSSDSKPSCWVNTTVYASDSTIGYENIGTGAIDVEINGTSAADFIGGTGTPTFVADCTCDGSAGSDLTIASAHQDCCTNLPRTDGSNSGTLATKLKVVPDSTTGTANLYFWATAP
jgi:hypothetical protein